MEKSFTYDQGFLDGAEKQLRSRKLVTAFASWLFSYQECQRTNNEAWKYNWREKIENTCRDKLPSGSGFDGGTTLDLSRSTPNRLVFATAFHHMDDNGFYDGWTNHDVIATPSLVFDYELRITGRNKRDIKEYIASAFREALDSATDD